MKKFLLASTVNLGEDNCTTVCSPGFPRSYPPNQYERWNLFSANGFFLNFSHFSLEGNFDFVLIHNGLNENDRFVEQTLSGTFNTSMTYVYDMPSLRLIFISDDKVEDSGFCVDILATNATSVVHLEDGDIERISSPKFPNNYPPSQHKKWKLLSTTGYVLNFTHFNLESNYDFLHIHNGKVATEIDTRQTLTGEFINKAYIFAEPYLELTFTSDEDIQLSGFRVEISATNISFLVHCDGLVVPAFEMCNFHVFCDNAIDEENCPVEEGEIVSITSPNFPNDYPRGQREVWRLLSTTGYVLNFTHFSLEYNYDFLHIRNRNTATRMDTTKILTGEFTNKAYIFEGPYVELTFTSDEIIQLSGFRVEISAPNISSLVHCDGLVVPIFEMCNFHVFCANAIDEENCPDNLEEGRIVRITSPNFPNAYPLRHKEAWRLLSTTGYVLNFTNFSLEYNYDFLYIHNGENATVIDSKKKLSGSFDNSFAYVYNGSFLHLTFTSDDYIVSSGFSVDIVAKNISTLVHCEGLLVPKYEMCNFHVFCANAVDEENCSYLLDVDQIVTIPSFIFPNVYHVHKGYIYNEWKLSSRSGYLLNVSASSKAYLNIESYMRPKKSYYKNRLDGSWKNGVSYAFEMPLLNIRIRLSKDQLTDEVGFHDSPSNGKYVGRTVLEHNLSVDILIKNVTMIVDCSKLCPNQTFTGPAGEINSPSDLRLAINYNCLCEWKITVRHNASVSLNITSMELPCDLVNLEITTPATNTLPDRISGICGNESGIILSEGNTLILRLRISTGDDGQVFRAMYKQSAIPGCGILPFNNFSHVRHHVCTASSAFIASANYPLLYEAGLDWFWYITTSPSTYIEVIFQEFDIKSRTAECEEDYLEFTLQSSNFRICNETLSEKNVSYFSDDNELTIKLNSNPYSQGGRFLAVYYERIFDRAAQVIALQGNVTCMNISQGGIQNCYCLFNHPHRISWLNASVFCQRCGTGGYLTTIRSQREMDFLQQLILRTGDPTQSAYIGLTWSDIEKRHVWSSGYPLSFTDWRVSKNSTNRQPDGGGEEKCSMITLWSYRETKNWVDIPCDKPLTSQFICQQTPGTIGISLPIKLSYDGNLTEDNCGEGQFQCLSGECILAVYLCDSIQDCSDQSDELDCLRKQDKTCPKHHFVCDDGSCIHSSFYCDYVIHCADSSDEHFCEFPSCSCNEFSCVDEQCIPRSKVCDLKLDCRDGLDEKNCDSIEDGFQCFSNLSIPIGRKCDGFRDCPGKHWEDEKDQECDYLKEHFECSPEKPMKCKNGACAASSIYCIFEYDVYGFFNGCRDATHLDQCESYVCPSNHFKCPNSYCIPERYRCNKRLDCPYGEDEEFCDVYKCAVGSYKCRDSLKGTTCLPQSQVCDNIVHCPERDDELFCDFQCPEECMCIGHVFNCSFTNWTQSMAEKIPEQLKELHLQDLKILMHHPESFNKTLMTVNDIIVKDIVLFPLLLRLDLSGNKIQIILEKQFEECENLRELYLNRNQISIITEESFGGLKELRILNLSGNPLTQIAERPLQPLRKLEILYIKATDIPTNKEGIFSGLVNLKTLYSDKFHFCCLKSSLPRDECYPKAGPFSGCENLMQNSFLRMSLWLLGIAAVVGNGYVIIFRIYRQDIFPRGERNPAQPILVVNLAIADFCIGVYLIILAWKDLAYDNVYYRYSEIWQTSALCKFAGFLSVLGSEASVMFLSVITVDRFQGVVFPFSRRKLRYKSTFLVSGCVWTLAITISALPLIPFQYFGESYYGRSSVCLAIPLINDLKPGWLFSIFVFLIFNFFSFLIMFICYIIIYFKATKSLRFGASVKSKRSERMDRQIQMTTRMFFLVFTDMACWMPIIIMGMLSQSRAVEISSGIYAWAAVLILPVNSALNPYLYTVLIKTTKRPNHTTLRNSRSMTVMETVDPGSKSYGKGQDVSSDQQREVNLEFRQSRVIHLLSNVMERGPHSLSREAQESVKHDLRKSLQFLHENSIIHGRISAENIIVVKSSEGDNRAFLLFTPSNVPNILLTECDVDSNIDTFELMKERDLQDLERLLDSL
ncbi:hypothetical protein HOLleu_32115 [Holothuria leucospilota]|uniref:G-protein coupled receptor GRL101 n=1 Tax=Holothuria leucospilota TaxID=206669 RepID=A0A9Q1BIF2_HOLLE|nr:hypothetical protein HOLleu_32115 [Holothuria leucospilota]